VRFGDILVGYYVAFPLRRIVVNVWLTVDFVRDLVSVPAVVGSPGKVQVDVVARLRPIGVRFPRTVGSLNVHSGLGHDSVVIWYSQ